MPCNGASAHIDELQKTRLMNRKQPVAPPSPQKRGARKRNRDRSEEKYDDAEENVSPLPRRKTPRQSNKTLHGKHRKCQEHDDEKSSSASPIVHSAKPHIDRSKPSRGPVFAVQLAYTPRVHKQVVKGTLVRVVTAWHPLLPVGTLGTVQAAHVDGKHVVKWGVPEPNTGTVNEEDHNWACYTQNPITPDQQTQTHPAVQASTPVRTGDAGSTLTPVRLEQHSRHDHLSSSEVRSPYYECDTSSEVSLSTAGATCSRSTSPTCQGVSSPTCYKNDRNNHDIPTALIFDYDDTLLPSSWLCAQGLTIQDKDIIQPDIQEKLEKCADLVILLLQKALDLVGDNNPIIITNAERGWIDLSAERFLPRAVPYLKRCHIMSARSTYEYMTPNFYVWKLSAFHFQLQNYFQCSIPMTARTDESCVFNLADFQKVRPPKSSRIGESSRTERADHTRAEEREVAQNLDEGSRASASMFPGQNSAYGLNEETGEWEFMQMPSYWSITSDDPLCHQLATRMQQGETISEEFTVSMTKQVISFGDSDSERQAAKLACQTLPNCYCKSIKLQEKPSASQLIKELQLLVAQWDVVVSPRASMDLMLQNEEPGDRAHE